MVIDIGDSETNWPAGMDLIGDSKGHEAALREQQGNLENVLETENRLTMKSWPDTGKGLILK